MEDTVTKAEIKTWLQEKHHTDSFGLGDMKLTLVQSADTKVHVLNKSKTKTLCDNSIAGAAASDEKTYVDFFFLEEPKACNDCRTALTENVYDAQHLDLTDYDYALNYLAETCILVEKMVSKAPFKNWQDTLISLRCTLLRYMANEEYEEAENTLPNTLKSTLAKTDTYIENNPNLLEDKEVQKLLFQEYAYILNIPGQDLEMERKNLEEACTNGEKILLKINYMNCNMYKDLFYMSGGQQCMYFLKTIVKTLEAKGVLFPKALIKIVEKEAELEAEYDENNFINLGEIKNTDTLEILETALSLNLAPTKALPTARLMHK